MYAKRSARSRGASGIGRFGQVVVLCALASAFAGCSEAVIQQYTRLGKWTRPPEQSRIISGNPAADQAAYDSATESFTEADWNILERIAPRPVWERIGAARAKLLSQDKKDDEPAGDGDAIVTGVVRRAGAGEVARRCTITPLGDKKLRIVYPMQHYGGVTAHSARAGGTDRRTISVKPVDLKPVVDLVTRQLAGKGVCTALQSENTLVIECAEAAKSGVLELLGQIDVPPRQVEISARIFEVKHDFDFQLGAKTIVQHVASDNTQSLAGAFNPKAFLDSLTNAALGDFAYQGSTMRLFQAFGQSGLSADITFQALADTGYIKEVASPRMTVVAGRTGYVLAGQELPISSARVSNNNIVTEKTTYKPIGVQLYITPQNIGDSEVRMHVLTVVSAVAGFGPKMAMNTTESAQATVNPIIDSREAETDVTVPDGDTLVMGGLRTVRHITRERKIPGLGDLAFFEWLFKSHRSQRQLTDLYFFVTPRIIRE